MAKLLPCGRPAPVRRSGKLDAAQKEKVRLSLNEYLKANTLNQSESRNQILDLILGQLGHFSIAELLSKVQEKYSSIGTATVYRNISLFLESGILLESLTDDNGARVYELADADHHDHIVCLDCGNIFEFHDDAIERAQEKLSQAMKFKGIHHKHVLYANCSLHDKESKNG